MSLLENEKQHQQEQLLREVPRSPTVTFAAPSRDSELIDSLSFLNNDSKHRNEQSSNERIEERQQMTKMLERYQRRVDASEFVPKLRQLRNEAIDFARERRQENIWDPEVDGPLLQDIIRTSQARERIFAKRGGGGKVLEPPELTKMLRDDLYQHTCDVRACCKMMTGWLCVFSFCHVPWIVAVFLIGVNYSVPNLTMSSNGMVILPSPEDAATQQACTDVANYLLGFFIIYCANIVIGLGVAVARNVDESKNACVRISPYITVFLSIAILGYNIYGIIVVWDYNLWNQSQSAACFNLRALAVAVLSFFFLLPIICFGLLQLLGGARKEESNAEKAVEAGTDAMTMPQSQAQQSATSNSAVDTETQTPKDDHNRASEKPPVTAQGANLTKA